MAETLPQEPGGAQADIFDEIGMALEELIAAVGPEDTLFALEKALEIASETAGQAPAQQPMAPPAAPEPANGFNAVMRGR